MGVQYIGFNSPDGASFGQNSSDKISFHGATPVDKPGSTEDLKDLLVAYGLMTDGGATPLDLDGGALITGGMTFETDSTINAGVDFALATTTGTKFGTGSTQKIGFLGATPVTRQASTTDLKDLLVSFGLLASGGASPLNLDSGTLTCLNISLANDLTVTDAGNVILATSTGTKFGTASGQKVAFLGASPATRQANTTDLKDLLVTFGLLSSGGATPLNLDAGALSAGTGAFSGDVTLSNLADIILATTTGTKFGTGSTQKLAFLGATPVTRQANTTDLKDLLVTFGLLASGGATPLNLDSGALTPGAVTFTADNTVNDGVDFALATTTGTKFGTGSTQKMAFLGATPATRQANTTDLKDLLVTFGLLANGGATPLNLDAGALSAGTGAFTGDVTLGASADLVMATTTGTKFGTVSTQKLAFWGGTPAAKTALTAAAVATTQASTAKSWITSTDAAAIRALVNNLRARVVAVGLG